MFANYPKKNAKLLVACGVIRPGKIIGTYFTTHKENIEWCWAVILAGGIPVILSPLSNDSITLNSQLENISKLFEGPTVLTAQRLKPTFQEAKSLNLVVVEQLSDGNQSQMIIGPSQNSDDLAVMLLTSGSTGHAKAVCYSHSQLLASVKAKAQFHKTDQNTNFMSWTCKFNLSAVVDFLTHIPAFDHSANFCEIHLNALYTGSNQVHVSTSDLVTQPDHFFRLLSKFEIGYTFIPNFLLAAAVNEFNWRVDDAHLDFRKLRVIMCGGEANRVCSNLQDSTGKANFKIGRLLLSLEQNIY